MLKDSGQLAREWEAANYARAQELNDHIDSLPTLKEKRAFYKTLSKEEQNGLLEEYGRRVENRTAPVGSLVKLRSEKNGIDISCERGNSMIAATHFGLATVIGQDGYGGHRRYLVLHPPWKNKEGTVIMFAVASSYQLEEVK